MVGKRKRSLELPITLLENGPTVDLSCRYEQKGVIADIVGPASTISLDPREVPQVPPSKRRKTGNTSTAESPPTAKGTTSSDRSSNFNNYIQSIVSSLTSDLESTSKGGDYEPFWNSQCQALSKSLWLPTVTGLHDSQRNLLSGSSVGTAGGLSIMTRQDKMNIIHEHPKWTSLRTSLQLSPSSQPESKVGGGTALKTMKVRIYPTWGQRQWFIKTMHNCRALRNEAVALEREGKLKPSDLSKGRVGSKLISTSQRKAEFDTGSEKWKAINSTPGHIRKQTLMQLKSNYDTAFTLLKKKHINHFKMKYTERKVKKGRMTLNIDATQVKLKAKNDSELSGFLPQTIIKERFKENGEYVFKDVNFGSIRYKLQGSKRRQLREKRAFPNVKGRFSILYEEPGRWFFCVAYEKPIQTTKAKFNDVSLDPGLRNFQNFYSADAQTVGTIDMPDMKNNLMSLINKIKYAQTMKDKARSKHDSTRWLNRFYFLWNKFKNKKNDLHWKTIRFLVDNFETIYIGDMGSKFIQQSKVLGKKNKQKGTFLSHYQFRQRLLESAATRTIVVVPESYTTKHCTSCGCINGVGSSKVYHCSSCKITLGRDDNGARNIHLKGKCM